MTKCLKNLVPALALALLMVGGGGGCSKTTPPATKPTAIVKDPPQKKSLPVTTVKVVDKDESEHETECAKDIVEEQKQAAVEKVAKKMTKEAVKQVQNAVRQSCNCTYCPTHTKLSRHPGSRHFVDNRSFSIRPSYSALHGNRTYKHIHIYYSGRSRISPQRSSYLDALLTAAKCSQRMVQCPSSGYDFPYENLGFGSADHRMESDLRYCLRLLVVADAEERTWLIEAASNLLNLGRSVGKLDDISGGLSCKHEQNFDEAKAEFDGLLEAAEGHLSEQPLSLIGAANRLAETSKKDSAVAEKELLIDVDTSTEDEDTDPFGDPMRKPSPRVPDSDPFAID